MSKPRATLTWTVVEDDSTWHSMQPARGAAGNTQPVRTTAKQAEWRLASMIAVILLLLVGGWQWYRQVERATVAGDLQKSIQPEVATTRAWPLSAVGLPSALLRDAAHRTPAAARPAASYAQMGAYHIQGDQAMAQVTIGYPTLAGDMLTYRESRFYRQTAEGWQQIAPIVDLLGPWQTLETKYFTIRYRAIDDLAVRQAAPRLDLLYEQMRRDFALPRLVGAQVATADTINVVIAYGPWNEYDTSFANRTITVPSPTLLSIPVEMTNTLVFYQSVVYPLASLMLADLYSQHPNISSIGLQLWRPIVGALRLWEVWNSDGPLAEGRQIVVSWHYQNAQAVSTAEYRITPAEYERLCRLYRVWKLPPRAMAIPLFCSAADESLGTTHNTILPARLDDLVVDIQDISHLAGVVDNTVAMETVLEYVVAAYGRDHLPRLITALDEHEEWLSLIPAVFGIPAADFEQGWQAYLTGQYGGDTK